MAYFSSLYQVVRTQVQCSFLVPRLLGPFFLGNVASFFPCLSCAKQPFVLPAFTQMFFPQTNLHPRERLRSSVGRVFRGSTKRRQPRRLRGSLYVIFTILVSFSLDKFTVCLKRIKSTLFEILPKGYPEQTLVIDQKK